MRMERAVDPGYSEEGAGNRGSGLGNRSVVAAGPVRRWSFPLTTRRNRAGAVFQSAPAAVPL